jgi:tripartite-type tricarboxylate transporter receptor subunit TctC
MRGWRILSLFFGLTLLAFLGQPKAQEKYPNRMIELVVPYGPGGTNDITARIYSEKLAQALKVPVTVVNRPGGGGIQGVLYVTRAKRNGYTILSATGSNIVLVPIITPEATFDVLRDFFPLGQFGSVPSVFVVRDDSPIKSFRELVEYARKNPGKLSNAVAGCGTGSYCNLQILVAKNNLNINTIPFKSGAETTTALLGGHVDMTFVTQPAVGAHLKAGT